MPQTSIAYAVGRVRAAARKPLGENQLERLLSAHSHEEALQLLMEMGWPEVGGKDVDQVSTNMLEEVCHRLREITSAPALTDSFLLRHDAQNLKALFKARILGIKPEGLSACGTIPLDVLRHAVTEHDYKRLPADFQAVMDQLEKKVVLEVNPMEIDVLLDQALYGSIARRMKSVKSKAALEYFTGKADLQNAVAFLRLTGMNTEEIRFMDILLPGGSIPDATWQDIVKKPDRLQAAFNKYPKEVQAALAHAVRDLKQLPALEKAADDHLIALFRPHRYEPYDIEVLIGWLLAHEREAGAVRLILAGKLGGFDEGLIRERLREAYGR